MKKVVLVSALIIQSCSAFAQNCCMNDSAIREIQFPVDLSTTPSSESQGNTHQHTPTADSDGDTPLVLVNPRRNPYYLNGGDKGLYNDLYTTLSKTAPVVQDSVNGRAAVDFVISKDGQIDINSIRVMRNRSVPDDYLKAAIEAIKGLGKFEPGKMNGIPIKVTYTIPVIYPVPSDFIDKNE